MPNTMLMCLVHARPCAIPVSRVSEIMRPRPVQPLAGTPPYVLGLAVIRGRPTPVVDLAGLLGISGASLPRRFVSVKVRDEHPVALAVTEVLGVQQTPAGSLQDVPSLAQAGDGQAIASVGTRHAELMLLLDTSHLLSDALWSTLAATLPQPESAR